MPRTKLPDILRRITDDRRAPPPAHRQRLPRRRRQHPSHPALRRARRGRGAARLAAGREILAACVDLGGSVTGEHGIGVEKIDADAPPLRAAGPARHAAAARGFRSRCSAAIPARSSRLPAAAWRWRGRGDRCRCERRGELRAAAADAARRGAAPALRGRRDRRRRRVALRRRRQRAAPRGAAVERRCGRRRGAKRRRGRPRRRAGRKRARTSTSARRRGATTWRCRCAGLDEIVAHDAGDMTVTAQAGVTLAALNERLARRRAVAAGRSAARGGDHAGRSDRRRPQRAAAPRARQGARPADRPAGGAGGRLAGSRRRSRGQERRRLRSAQAVRRLVRHPRSNRGSDLQGPASPARGSAVRVADGVDRERGRGGAGRSRRRRSFPSCSRRSTPRAPKRWGWRPAPPCWSGAPARRWRWRSRRGDCERIRTARRRRCEAGRAEAVAQGVAGLSAAGERRGAGGAAELSARVPGRRCWNGSSRRRRPARLSVEIAAHAGSGVAWCQVVEAADPGPLALFAEWARIEARGHGSWLVFESLPAALRDRVDPWGYAEPALALMARVKKALDPAAMFSPGRFVGGL